MVFCLSAVPLPLRLRRHTTRPPEPKNTHGLKTKARSYTDPPKLTLACHQSEQHPISATLCPKPEPPHDRLSNPPEPPYPPDLAVSRPLLRFWALLTPPEPPKPPKPPDPPDLPPSRYKLTKNHSKPPTTLHPNLLHSATNLSPVSHLKDRPLPPPSTLTPAPPSPARRSMPSTMTPASTQHLFLPSTMTPADPTDLERPSMEKFSTYGVNNNKPLLRRAVIAGKRLSRYRKLGQGSGLLMVGLQSPTRLIKPRQEEFQIVDALLNGFDDDPAREDLLSVARPNASFKSLSSLDQKSLL